MRRKKIQVIGSWDENERARAALVNYTVLFYGTKNNKKKIQWNFCFDMKMVCLQENAMELQEDVQNKKMDLVCQYFLTSAIVFNSFIIWYLLTHFVHEKIHILFVKFPIEIIVQKSRSSFLFPFGLLRISFLVTFCVLHSVLNVCI